MSASRRLPPLPAPPLRIAFLGTPELAATILDALLRGPDRLVGVFSRADAPRGRGLARRPPPVAERAREAGLPLFQPAGWRDGAAVRDLSGLSPDLVVVAAYGALLPQAALDVPRFGCLNVHASLLPRWRGADPISRAILEGDAETGVTIMRMVLEMDAGPILHQRRTAIAPDDTRASLERRLAALGAAALEEALELWRAGALEERSQDESAVTFAPRVRKEDGTIDWSLPAARIERAVRALQPWPGASTSRSGEALRIWAARVEPARGPAAPPGTVLAVDPAGPLVATGEGSVRLLEVQAPGRRRMPAADWARGARLEPGEHLGR